MLLRDIFTAAGGTHDDWDTYDRVMREERRTAVLIAPTRTYSKPHMITPRAESNPRHSHQTVAHMTRDDVLELCGSFPGAVEDYPFGDGVAVFKVGGRMFALVSLDGDPGSVNLKCDPGLALELRAVYAAVRPGYHQDKRRWNTVELNGSIDDDELREMIDHPYERVVEQLPHTQRTRLFGG